jgi:PHP family Zn ribbon phosphoesterase
MNIYRADLHIHTVLSPCGDLEMSPVNVVARAKELRLDIIGITDHNTTRHCALTKKLGAENGIFVLTGAEVTTKEEVHCLTFFDKTESLEKFQEYLTAHLPFIKNEPSIFGYQVVVDEQENILEEIDSLLIASIDQSIEQVRAKVKELEGLFIPAHVDRPSYGILGQLGFMPGDLNPDAIEIFHKSSREVFLSMHPEFNKYVLIRNSDAHYIEQIGQAYSSFLLDHVSFGEISMAFRKEQGREVIC